MLVLKRNSGQTLVVNHFGESLVIKIDVLTKSSARVSLDGPKSFEILRSELVGVGRRDVSKCLVNVPGEQSPRHGIVLSSTSGASPTFDVMLADGREFTVKADAVTIIEKKQKSGAPVVS